MIEPTVGRIVWYRQNGPHIIIEHDDQPLAAIVAYVHSARMVNLTVFDANGVPSSRTSVQLVQEGDEVPPYAYCEWMPYQKGQAAKAEQALKQQPLTPYEHGEPKQG
jgi:hypothetical protein